MHEKTSFGHILTLKKICYSNDKLIAFFEGISFNILHGGLSKGWYLFEGVGLTETYGILYCQIFLREEIFGCAFLQVMQEISQKTNFFRTNCVINYAKMDVKTSQTLNLHPQKTHDKRFIGGNTYYVVYNTQLFF